MISKKQVHCTHSCTQPGATVPCIKINRISQYKGKKSNPTYTKAITDEGSYKVQLRQLLYGIPYFACNGIGDGYEPGVWLSDARVSVAHRGADGYMVLAMLWQVEEVVCVDVPLLSFTDAKPAFEKEIMAGRLRTVDTIALGYAPYADSDDPDVFWLLPVLYVKGGYTTDPKREFTPFYDVDGSIADDGIERREMASTLSPSTCWTVRWRISTTIPA